jgi:glutamate-1-semialdehyde 2,1-aminomutase
MTDAGVQRRHAGERREAATRFYAALKQEAGRIEERYRTLTPRSARLAHTAQSVLPGGCARQGVFREPYPTYIAEAQGSTLVDVDERSLVDFCFNATALPLGHAHPEVVAAVSRQLGHGTSYLSPTSREIDLAAEISARLPSAERLIFTNSGSEAVMMALRLARCYTGRPLVAKFEGAFHGSYDDVLWSVAPHTTAAGPANTPSPVAASEGLLDAHGRTLVLPYNATEATEQIIEAHGRELAAVIIEPVAYRMGLVLPTPSFLTALCRACSKQGVLLIFDEVLCFRVGYHGMQGMLDIRPDLTVLGKIIGGGFPVGAVAGRADIMRLADPRNPRVYHTGTFAANPITLAAGKATLDMWTPSVIDDLNAKGDRLRERLRQTCADVPLQVTGVGSLFKISATTEDINDYRAVLTCDAAWHRLASLALLNDGLFFNPQLNGCIATTTTSEQVERFLAAFAALIDSGCESARL